jgi:hypothetical protein
VPIGVCVPDLVQSVKFDYDYGGSFGGPIKRDKSGSSCRGATRAFRRSRAAAASGRT